MSTLHNVSKHHTHQNIRNLLKLQFINIKHIKIRRYFDQCLSLLNIQDVKPIYLHIDYSVGCVTI